MAKLFLRRRPVEVLTCATRTGAEIMGRGAEFGTLEEGKLADVLVVDGDVLADITLLEGANGGAVFSVGSICYPSALPVDDGVSRVTANVLRRFLE